MAEILFHHRAAAHTYSRHISRLYARGALDRRARRATSTAGGRRGRALIGRPQVLGLPGAFSAADDSAMPKTFSLRAAFPRRTAGARRGSPAFLRYDAHDRRLAAARRLDDIFALFCRRAGIFSR